MGATLTYALNAHSPWEGYRIAINGTEGRAELEVVERAAVLVGSDGNVVLDPSALPESSSRTGGQRLTLQRHWEAAQEVPIVEGEGGHGGGDALLLSDVFRGPGTTGWSGPRTGWTACGPSRSAWRATSRCGPGRRSRSPTSGSAWT